MKWFKNITTLEALKKTYKVLAMKHHPDLGGDTQTMQEINNEYDEVFKLLKQQNPTSSRNAAAQEPVEAPEEFRKIIDALINLKGLEIEICGSWLWITGNTYPHRATLKGLGFGFSNSKKAWYWHKGEYRKRGKKSYTMDDIRTLHGSDKVRQATRQELCG